MSQNHGDGVRWIRASCITLSKLNFGVYGTPVRRSCRTVNICRITKGFPGVRLERVL